MTNVKLNTASLKVAYWAYAFLIYINDLCTLPLKNCSLFTYADDTTILVYEDDWNETEKYTQNALNVIVD